MKDCLRGNKRDGLCAAYEAVDQQTRHAMNGIKTKIKELRVRVNEKFRCLLASFFVLQRAGWVPVCSYIMLFSYLLT